MAQQNINQYNFKKWYVKSVPKIFDISLFEKYQSVLLPYLEVEEKRIGRKLNEGEIASIYAQLLQDNEQVLLKTSYKPIPKPDRSKEEQLQEYFTIQ